MCEDITVSEWRNAESADPGFVPSFTKGGEELKTRSVQLEDARYYRVTREDGTHCRFRQPSDRSGAWVDSIPGGDPPEWDS